MYWSLIGIVAAICTMFGFVPQIAKVLKTKSAKDVSLTTLLQLSMGVTLWILYGIHLRDAIIITANSVALVTLIISLTLYFNFGRVRK
jgi:MtN3 and saliva related transmembrane protein